MLDDISRYGGGGVSETETHRDRLRASLSSDLTDDIVVIDHVVVEEEHDLARNVRAETPWTVDCVGGVRSNRGGPDELPSRCALRALRVMQLGCCAAIHAVQTLFRG